jgi:hypothetical protein
MRDSEDRARLPPDYQKDLVKLIGGAGSHRTKRRLRIMAARPVNKAHRRLRMSVASLDT